MAPPHDFIPAGGKQDGYVWRVQPAGADLHSQQSEASNGEKINGVFVFDHLDDLAAVDWMNEKNVELVKIKAGKGDTFTTHDQEGRGLKRGQGEIVGRMKFPSTRDVKRWAEDGNSAGWSGDHRLWGKESDD